MLVGYCDLLKIPTKEKLAATLAHDLPSVATVQTALRALGRKEIAGRDEDGNHAIVEPFFAEWINREQRDASVGAHLQQGA